MSERFRKLKLNELNRVDAGTFRQQEKLPVIAILDNIRSLHNVGSIFRSADAFRIEALWLCGITAQPPHREIQKTALGATETVNWRYFESPEDALKEIRNLNGRISAVEQATHSTSIESFQSDERQLFVIFGNEVEGVRDEFMKVCDDVIEIPQYGTKHSLNVSVAAGIVFYQLSKQFKS